MVASVLTDLVYKFSVPDELDVWKSSLLEGFNFNLNNLFSPFIQKTYINNNKAKTNVLTLQTNKKNNNRK